MSTVLTRYKDWSFSKYNELSTEEKVEALSKYLCDIFDTYMVSIRRSIQANKEPARLLTLQVPADVAEDVQSALKIATMRIKEERSQTENPAPNNDPSEMYVEGFVQSLDTLTVTGGIDITANPDEDQEPHVLETLETKIQSEAAPLEWVEHQFRAVNTEQLLAETINSLDSQIGFSASLPVPIPYQERKAALLTAMALSSLLKAASQQQASPVMYQ